MPIQTFTERSQKEDTDINDGQISDMEDNDISDDGVNFVTVTPVKRKVNCKECKNETQCVDCFVRQEHPHFSPCQVTILSTPDRVQQVAI
jgi:hypothetical protein